ncbi:MAG: hypothetical protein K6F96_02985 [Bacteroidales bacterium]|nr:hypothetical protein [Bacteroidales bacterium]
MKDLEALKTLFLESTLPCWVIFGLLTAATLFAFFGRGWSAIIAPVLLLVATAIEVLGLLKCGTGMLWWLDGADFHSMVGVQKLLLFSLAVIMQVGSIYIFGRNVTEDELEDLVIWQPVIALIVAAVVAVVLIVGLTLFHVPQKLVFLIGGVVFLVLLISRVWESMRENCGVLGIFGGVLFTLFVFVWGIGSLVAIVLLVISLFKSLSIGIVLPILAGGFVLLFVTGLMDSVFGSVKGISSYDFGDPEERKRAEEEKKAEEAQRKERDAEAARRKSAEEERQRQKMNKQMWG